MLELNDNQKEPRRESREHRAALPQDAKLPTLCETPNKFANRLRVELNGSSATFDGYERFILTRHTLSASEHDLALRKKQDLLRPYFQPRHLSQRTLLDIGANAGFFSFWAVQSGADNAIALDIDDDYLRVVEETRAKLGFENLRVVKSNFIDWLQPADIVLALALIHWVYSCTALSKSLEQAVERLASLTKYLLIVEWIDPEDPAIEFFHHIDWNKEFVKGPYNSEAFEAALARHFSTYKMIGEVSTTRRIYVAFRTDEMIDLSGPLPFIKDRKSVIYSRWLGCHEGIDYWSRIYDDRDYVVKQATSDLAAREAEFLSRLRSEYFPQVFSVGSEDEYSTITLEKIHGPTLCEKISEKDVDLIELHSLTQHCLNVLEELKTQGILHRDVTCENILVRDGTPILIDFGWAISDAHCCFTPTGLGGSGRPPDGSFCDVFSMGKVFEAVNRHRYRAFDRVIELMTEPDASLRITDLDTLRMLFTKAFESSVVDENQQFDNLEPIAAQPDSDRYGVAVSQLLDKISKLTNQLSLMRTEQEQLGKRITDKKDAIHDLTRQLAEKQETISNLSQHLATTQAQLEKITTTIGWRFLSLYGRIKYPYLLRIYKALGLLSTGSGLPNPHLTEAKQPKLPPDDNPG